MLLQKTDVLFKIRELNILYSRLFAKEGNFQFFGGSCWCKTYDKLHVCAFTMIFIVMPLPVGHGFPTSCLKSVNKLQHSRSFSWLWLCCDCDFRMYIYVITFVVVVLVAIGMVWQCHTVTLWHAFCCSCDPVCCGVRDMETSPRRNYLCQGCRHECHSIQSRGFVSPFNIIDIMYLPFHIIFL